MKFSVLSLHWLAVVGLAGVFISLSACSADPASGDSSLCVPNQTFECKCVGDPTGVKSGVQACNAFGNGLEECQCAVGTGGAGSTVGGATTGGSDTTSTDGGTTEGADTGDATGDTGEPCLGEYEKQCVGTLLYWFDSCGDQTEQVADCGSGGCLDGACQGVCTPKVEKKCHNGNPWWFDSCGEPGSGADICQAEQFCLNATCVKPFYDGNWTVTADPDTKPLGGLGNAQFLPTTLALLITGSNASAELLNFTVDVTYTGTLEGKVLKMSASYDEGGQFGAHHEENVVVTFSDPLTFTGTITDQITADLGLGGGAQPIGQLVWLVTGKKQ